MTFLPYRLRKAPDDPRIDSWVHFVALADSLGLVRSGGSDWHGAADGFRTLGSMRVPAAWLEAQDAILARRGAEWVA